eukprot:g15156.t1
MPALHKLSTLQVESLGPGKYSDGGGLWLHRRDDGGAQWFLRVTIHGRRREMGLGSASEVSLKEARAQAVRWRTIARSGVDPIKERERLVREAAKSDHTLKSVALEAFEARKAELKGDGRSGRWFSPLELHVLPKLGKVPIEEIDQQDIRQTLAPIWHSKEETAQKALSRLGIVIKYAAAMGLDVDMQATEKAKALLGRSRQERKHIPAMPWKEVPSFFASLEDETITHLALKLTILTAVRSHPIRHLHVDELHDDVWVIPAEKMKTGKEFRAPLSELAIAVIDAARKHERGGYLFPSLRKGVISDATMSRLVERRGLEARPHGFRSSFRTWCAEATDTPREVAEMALAHSIGTKVELSYRRTDFMERRRVLMERWAQHVLGADTNVLRLVSHEV